MLIIEAAANKSRLRFFSCHKSRQYCKKPRQRFITAKISSIKNNDQQMRLVRISSAPTGDKRFQYNGRIPQIKQLVNEARMPFFSLIAAAVLLP